MDDFNLEDIKLYGKLNMDQISPRDVLLPYTPNEGRLLQLIKLEKMIDVDRLIPGKSKRKTKRSEVDIGPYSILELRNFLEMVYIPSGSQKSTLIASLKRLLR